MISAPPLSLSALLLCFFDWARKSNLSGLQNYELIYLAIKPKPFAQPSFYHWKNIKKKKYYAFICYFYIFLFLNFFRILVGVKGTIYWTPSPEDPNISLRDCTCQILCWWVLNVSYVITKLHNLCYLALGSSAPLTTPHPQPPFLSQLSLV